MKKFLLFFAAMFMAVGMKAQEPLFVADAAIVENEEWAANADGSFPNTTGIKVEAYEGYMIVRGVAGVEGYDLMVEFDENDNLTSLTPIVNGEEGETATSGYGTFFTGLEGSFSYFQPYIGEGYCYAGIDTEDNSGYLLMLGYNADGAYLCYYLEFPVAAEELPEGCLYVSKGEVTETEGWGATLFPYLRDVKVEAYEGYSILRGWAGVEGYDLMVEFDESDNILSVTPIVNGEEGETVTSGYATLYTGREDFEYIDAYIMPQYSYAGQSEEESGYVVMSCFIGEDWTYYYCTWPQGEDGPKEWENPFEGEATLLYSAIAKTGSVEDDEDGEWGETLFPSVENIKVDVYDKYIYIHAIGGVEGYDAKVAYTNDEDNSILSIMAVEDGVDGEPSKVYSYLYTGLDDIYCVQAYNNYSYAASNDDQSGYVLLASYLYDVPVENNWNYYYISWGNVESSIETVSAESMGAAVFNLFGQKVGADYKGFVVKNGKKAVVK